VNWRKLLAWTGAFALLAGVLVLLSRPPGPPPGSVPVPAPNTAPAPRTDMDPSNLLYWQTVEFTNQVLKHVDTNAPPRRQDQDALNLQDMIIRQTGPRR
jgi:hypothetical protein